MTASGSRSADNGFVEVNGVRMHYGLEGPVSAPVVMLCHGLLGNMTMWAPQMAALSARYRVLRFDNRGHGRSGVTPPPYTIAELGSDAIGLLDALGLREVHFVGCSLGGMIGQAIGATHRDRLRSLVLVGSRSVMPPASLWDERIALARSQGTHALVQTMLERWFTPGYRASHPQVFEDIAEGVRSTPVEGFVGACMAIRDMDHTDLLRQISVPTLVTSAEDDPGVPVSDTLHIQASIPGAECAVLPRARHLFCIERADAFNVLLLDWLERH